MKEKHTLAELEEIYNAPEFVEKLKQISNMPIKGVEYLYKHINLIIEEHGGDIQGKEYDPYNILVMVDKGENLVDDEALHFLMTSVPKTDDDDDVMEYWGEKSIEKHCPKACFAYMSFLMARGLRPEQMLVAYRWAKCSEEFGMMLDLASSIFIEQFPGSFETGISLIEENLEEEILIDLFDTAQEKQDYCIYFLIIFIMQKRGIDFDKNQLKDICIKANVESFYYFITDEKLPNDKDFDAVNNDCLQMIEFANEAVEKVQKEIFLRTLYEYCEKYMDGSLKSILTYAMDTINKRKDYKNKYIDLAVIVHARYNVAKESNDLDLVAQLEEFYRKLCAQIFMSSMHVPQALDSPVDKEKLKQALYFDEKSQANLLSSKNTANFDENTYNFDLDCDGEEEYYEEEDFGETEYNGKCSALVEFDNGKCYEYNNDDGYIKVGDRVFVSGKLAGVMGTVKKLGWYRDDDFMQTIIENYGSDCEFDIKQNQPATMVNHSDNMVQDTQNVSCQIYGRLAKDANIKTNYSANSSNTKSIPKINNKKKYIIFSIVATIILLITIISVVAGTTNKFEYWETSYGYDVKGCTKKSVKEITIKGTHNGKPVSIGNRAFEGMYNLESVILEDGVTSIGEYAFEDCENLTSITIPNSVTKIGDSAFYNCTSLTSITIPDGITTINTRMFYGCKSLESITIPSSVNFIEEDVFSGCSSLTKVNITDIAAWCKIRFYRWDSNPLDYAKNLYLNGNLLTNLTIPNSVTTISEYAFYSCKSIKSVTIPNSVTSIGGSAFKKSSSLTKIMIPDSVTSLGSSAFDNCSSLTEVSIGSGLTSISAYAFQDCISLKNITIPYNITSIGGSAFEGCSNLTNITIPDSVTSISSSAFENCSNLTNVTIGSEVTSIGQEAFKGCITLTGIIIPNSVTYVGSSVFENCSNLTSATIGNGVTSIGKGAFKGCSSLNSVVFKISDGWNYDKSFNSIPIDSSKLADPTIAANYLRSEYCYYNWKRK